MKMPANDIVIDANVMSLFGTRRAGLHRPMFAWLQCCGGICISKAVLREYARQGSPLVAAMIDSLTRRGRCSSIKNSTIRAFRADARYAYTCNAEDVDVARTVFRSVRKVLVSSDVRLRSDVAGFPGVNGVKPQAFEVAPKDLLVPSGGGCASGAH
jgi:hypothetical protein